MPKHTFKGIEADPTIAGLSRTVDEVTSDPDNPVFVSTTLTGPFYESVRDALTATPGGGQAGALQLSLAEMHRVTVVATAGDSIKLPTSAVGLTVIVVNTGANPVQVFGAGTDTINGVAAATGISMPANSIDMFACPTLGAWFCETGVGFAGSLFTESAASGLTAKPGGGAAGATPITTQTARFTTVATNGDSALLPPSAPGLELMVINTGAASLQIFAQGTDTIDGLSGSVGVSQMANSLVIFTCANNGAWFTEGLATGYGGPGLQTSSYRDLITAFATGGQASATQLANMINRITTVAAIGDSVKLPVSAPGLMITVINAAANSANVFPQTGDQINALGANAAFALPGGKTAQFYTVAAGQWHSILSA